LAINVTKITIFFNFSVDPIHSPNSQQQTMELVTSSPYAYKEKKKRRAEKNLPLMLPSLQWSIKHFTVISLFTIPLV